MKIGFLHKYRLTVARLKTLGARRVTFHLQLAGVPLNRLKPLTPRQREATLRGTLKRQFASLTQEFPAANLTSRNPKKGSWTLDGNLSARDISRLSKRPEVSQVWVEAIDGLSPYPSPKTKGWFCVWGVVAIQIEGQRAGMMSVEDRFVLVRAFDAEDAVHRLDPAWRRYAEPYLNPDGYLVRWQLVEIKDVYDLMENKVSPEGTEVYSRLRTVRIKPEYRWRGPNDAVAVRTRQTERKRATKAKRGKKR